MHRDIAPIAHRAEQAFVRLRPMLRADLATVLSLERQCHPLPWPIRYFRRLLRGRGSCRVFERNGAVIGYGIVGYSGERAHIMNLCIAPDHRRHGLGRKMLLHLLDVAQRRGANLAWLEVSPRNRRAIVLYKRLGFYRSARRKGYYRHAPQGRRDALILTLELGR